MLVDRVEFYRLDANRKLDPERRSELGQFMTPSATARLMASMFEAGSEEVSLLDAGAGVGSLTAAFVDQIAERERKPKRLIATAYEIEPTLSEYLSTTLDQCRNTCESAGVRFEAHLIQRDFIDEASRQLRHEMFAPIQRFTCAILNPPYKKISSDSDTRLRLREIGIETSNLYTGFLSLVVMLLAPGGELVAITPRSFCNGPYFKPFRKLLLDSLSIRRIHVFESRQVAFKEDEVLQENVILYGVKGRTTDGKVTITSSTGPDDDLFAVREIGYAQLVRPDDPEHFIHVVPDELGASVAEKIGRLYWTLREHDLEVSTGRVVDFRATGLLREFPSVDTAPLIHPRNLENGFVQWPKPGGKKAQAIALLPSAQELLVPKGTVP